MERKAKVGNWQGRYAGVWCLMTAVEAKSVLSSKFLKEADGVPSVKGTPFDGLGNLAQECIKPDCRSTALGPLPHLLEEYILL